jgi:signal transduction histidine kinase
VELTVTNRLENDACSADVNQFTQVLLNVVLNAIQACDTGDGIKIDLVNGESRDGSGREMAVVMVEDDGTGVPADVRESLFEPFVTTKTHGTGLGLALCQQIVEEHRGKIYCEFLETGTRFTIELPLEASAASAGQKLHEERKLRDVQSHSHHRR